MIPYAFQFNIGFMATKHNILDIRVDTVDCSFISKQ